MDRNVDRRRKSGKTKMIGAVKITTADPWCLREDSLWEGDLPWYAQPEASMGGGMITDRFIYIKMPRTGGTPPHKFLPTVKGLRLLQPIMAHSPHSHSVARCKQAGWPVPPAFVFVRNPWEWNVASFCGIRIVNRKWFCGTWDDFMEYQRYSRHWGCPDLGIAGISSVWEYLEAGEATHFGKIENYADDWVSILGELIPDLVTAEEVREHFSRPHSVWLPPDGKLRPYQEFYTPAQRDMVARLERDIIKRFEYTFDDVGRDYH